MQLGKLLIITLIGCVSGYSQIYQPPPKSANLVKGIDFKKAVEIDKKYKSSFDECDKTKKCREDANRLKALFRFGDSAVFFDSKMSLDLDGSWVACNCGNSIGKSDQCSTSYFWKTFPNDYDKKHPEKFCKFYQNQDFVDSNKIPFIVIPGGFENHFKINDKPYNFIEETGANLGVVIYKDKLIPVMVADGGPSFRIGEGSAKLFKELGEDRCHKYDGEQCVSFEKGDYSIPDNVLFFVFPNSQISKETLNKDNAAELIKVEGLKKFEELKNSYK